MSDLLAVTFHAERLERHDVWTQVARAAETFRRRRIPLTFFVHPFRAIRAGFDLRDRLVELRDLGHEIGQHTHYYAQFEQTATGTKKRTSIDLETIERCLARDHSYLAEAGFSPTGYVSGGWAIHDDIFAWLRENRFRYDCSFRTFPLPYANPASAPGDDATGPFWMDHLVEVPTTAALTTWMQRRPLRAARRRTANGAGYELVYLHDTDLLDLRKRVAFRRFVPLLARGRRSTTAGELASLVAPETGGGEERAGEGTLGDEDG
jgi:peptidoglycan/xylan/chitin deacetylase (PgdA/CDA1 family)